MSPAALEDSPFNILERSGDPATLVCSELASAGERQAVLVRPDRRALVLGSAQGDLALNEGACASEGLEIARRRSGGGAVLVGPGEQVWLDVFLPSGDPLFEHDVGKSAHWLGELWCLALNDVGATGAVVHTGAMRPGPYGRLICFAGLGPGEVCWHEKKLVGISQRRDRNGAWFHSMVRTRPSAAVLAALTSDEASEPALRAHLEGVTMHLELAPERVEEALIDRIRDLRR